MDEDFLLAVQLQEQFDSEYESSVFPSNAFDDVGQNSKKRKVDGSSGSGSDVVPYWKRPNAQPERPLSIVDASWEMLDPSPDVRAMFLEFNDMFFWGKLSGVEVKWSPRMTLCAGVCSYEGRGGLCSIRLSEPLLKLRPRKDLVETLLHEMIHALLFVTQNNRDRDGHGPEFCKHMNRINQATGTKISIYHTFHDEVDVYRQHWWRCDGPCQNRKPYFGYVKRAMNRAPSHLDPWWEDHRRSCGGTYTKIKEPEGYGKKGKKNGKTADKEATGGSKPPTQTSGSQDIRNLIPFSGKGFTLGGSSQTSTSSSPLPKPSSSPFSSPTKKPLPPSSPLKPFNSPSRSGATATFPPVKPAASAGQKPPIKRSVSNTRVFVNINGSPVRIPKPHKGGGQGADKIQQRSIQDLFNSRSSSQSSNAETSPKVTASTSSLSSSPPKKQHPTFASSSTASPTLVLNKNNPDKASQSNYFGNGGASGGADGRSQGSKKRPWDQITNSSAIFDLFQKNGSAESMRKKSPVVPPSTATSSSSSSSSTSLSSTPSVSASSSSSSSSSSLMVSCPVCQTKVQESMINQHLDSCLS